MKRYETYKETSSKFIKNIPSHWKKLKVKYLVDRNTYYPVGDGDHGSIKPSMYQTNGIPYIRVQNLSWDGKIDISNAVYISEEIQKANKKSNLFPGDILIAKTGATIGKLGLISEEIKEANTTSSVGKLTVDLKFFNPKYILYCFQSKNFNDQMWLEASQKSAQPGFNIDDLIEFELAIPKRTEQTQIANYLDYKTGLIDAIIAQKETLIKKLKEQRQAIINEAVTKGLNPNVKLKDSGIKWLGDIPEHWELVKLKYLVNHSTAKGDGNSELKIALENIESGTGRLLRNDEKEFEGDLKIFEKDDILFNKLRPYLSKVLIAPEDGECVSELLVFKAREKKVFYKFLFHRLSSEQIISIVDSSTYGAKMPRASIDFILELPIPVPEISEQEAISDFIDKKQRKIDISSNELKLSIEKLKEYRQSIISEAVTGKVDVRDWQAPKS